MALTDILAIVSAHPIISAVLMLIIYLAMAGMYFIAKQKVSTPDITKMVIVEAEEQRQHPENIIAYSSYPVSYS